MAAPAAPPAEPGAVAASLPDEEDDDFFKDIYGRGYAGPTDGRNGGRSAPAAATQRPPVSVDETEEEAAQVRDPNELPTDFTTREAKLWDAKAKASERNWKRRREEELVCKVCGESGHFAQV